MKEEQIQQLKQAEILGELRACALLLRKAELRDPKAEDIQNAILWVVKVLQRYDSQVWTEADQERKPNDASA